MDNLPENNGEVRGYESTLDSMIEELGGHDREAYDLMKEGLWKLQNTLTKKGYKGYWNGDK